LRENRGALRIKIMDIRFNHLWTRVILLTAAASPLFAQIPSVNIDGPAPNAVVAGTVTVSGWAIDNTTTNLGTAISSVVVQVDGGTVGNATMGISRPDVCDQYPARPGCPNVGWAYSLDTTKLAAGGHTITVVATDTNLIPTAGSTSVQVFVGSLSTGPLSTPLVVIDSPTAGSVVAGNITVSGWAIDAQTSGASAISAVQVLVDGAVAGNATYGQVRPDVCSSHPAAPNCPNVGYTFSLNASNYAAGPHTLSVIATDSDASPDSGSASAVFTVTATPAVLIDSLTSGAVVSGNITVGGWAIDNTPANGPIGGVNVLVDGNLVGAATYGISRPDVCAVYPSAAGCPNVGFSFMLNTKTLAPGSHTLTAVATNSNLPAGAGSWTINITVVALLTVTIESPVPGSTVAGNVAISGWALDTTNSSPAAAISSVLVSLDGLLPVAAMYGISRPDVCALYSGGAGCPNVGFLFTLNTTSLTPGNHTVNVTARDSDNPPNAASSNVTINIGSGHSFNLDTPANGSVVSGVVTISGWALAPAGTQINAIKVYLDGNQIGLGNYGVLRPDVCAVYPGGTGCPNVGFSFYLDTTSLSPGLHTIGVVASIADGAPPVGSGMVTVTVGSH
jgi:hypothetical protein